MFRAVPFLCSKGAVIKRQKLLFPSFQFLKSKTTSPQATENVSKVIKDDKAEHEASDSIFKLNDSEQLLSKNKPPFLTGAEKIEEVHNKGFQCWQNFCEKHERGILSMKDFASLLKNIRAEAHFEKYKEAPPPAYTISCFSIAPLCSVGLLTLINGTAFPGFAAVQLTYSAVLLSFLGGVAWGNTILEKNISFSRLSWAIVPPLFAWSALLLPLPMGLLFTAVGFTISLVNDILLTSHPQWFKSLRYILTIIALISLLPTFVSSVRS